MEIIETIRSRRSIRSFKPEPVPRKVLEELLDTCRWAPSASNTQPWEFAILGGRVIENIKARFLEKAEEGWDSSALRFRDSCPDIPQPELTGLYHQRSLDARARVDTMQFPLGTENVEEKRHAYMLSGSRFYDAPNAIIIYAERSLYPKVIFDAGLIAQTICLAALAYGLGTCLMTRAVNWPAILRELLEIPDSKLLVLGMAIGYPDTGAQVNNFVRARDPLDTFTRWYGF
ncbi:nitroreductase [Chloroflexota bacterium]